MDSTQQFHSMAAEDVLKSLVSVKEGLTDEEAAKRLVQHGPNELIHKKKSLLLMFLKQFRNIMVYILFAALALTILLPFFEGHTLTAGSFIDAVVIFAILLLNALLGFVQEYKAEQAIEMLEKLSASQVVVRRNGVPRIIPSRELVAGDIVLLETGDKVSADGRLIRESHIELNESLLTGESSTVDKTTEPVKESAPLADRRNMAFGGTLVTRGSGEYIVTATGMHTEMGGIASLVSAVTFPETPLEHRLKKLSALIGMVVLAITAVIIFVGWLKSIPLIEIILIGASLAVSAVPEGLPAVMTVCLALGVRRMAKKSAIVRRLDSLETLGSVTVICADKTGTITENKMRVVEIWAMNAGEEVLLIQAGASANRAQLPAIGDPTEIGLLEEAQKRGIERLPIDEEVVPFSSEEMYMRTRHGDRQFLKGAPEKIVMLSADENPAPFLTKNEEYAKRGLRVLGIATGEGAHVRLLGLIAMEDPPRAGTQDALAQAKHAGIRTMMITGDNVQTAKAIADRIGLAGDAIPGSEIDALTDADLRNMVKSVTVFARVTPAHKVKILTALQANGEIVAMSGDGVNDAPALKQAHVGIAMGKKGTDAAREAASIVLADDHYATIVTAVREGRRIYDNIRKFVLFLLRSNFDELLFIVTAVLMDLPLPYLPIHILWINLVTDGLPALALSMEKEEPDIMNRPPRPAREPILADEWMRLIIAALLAYGALLLFYLWQLLGRGVPTEEARTLALTLAVTFELFMVFTVRSRRPLWEIGFFGNRWLLGAVAIPFITHLVILYTPLRAAFSLTAFPVSQWAIIFAICAGALLLFESLKLVRR